MSRPPRRAGGSGYARAVGLALGYGADVVFGDPQRYHPVAGFGTTATAVERALYADRRTAGLAHLVLLVGVPTGLGWAAQRGLARRPWAQAALTATVTWTALGGSSLVRQAGLLQEQLADGDLPAARRQITALVSRDPAQMTTADLARAGVESVAENTSDAVTGPLVWGAVAGVPGIIMYRCVNTLDAMVGYRNQRYGRFGWAAARSDDLVNLVPARLSAGLAAVLAPLVGGSTRQAWRAICRDAGAHPSPNGGVVEAAFAGALGVQLGGVNVYGGHREDRGTLGQGSPPDAGDIARANRVSRLVSTAALVVACATVSAGERCRRQGKQELS